MALAEGRLALKNKLLTLAGNTDSEKTPDQAIDEFIDAIEAYIQTATVLPTSETPMSNSGGPVVGAGSLI